MHGLVTLVKTFLQYVFSKVSNVCDDDDGDDDGDDDDEHDVELPIKGRPRHKLTREHSSFYIDAASILSAHH